MLEKPHVHRLRAVLAIQMAVIVALVLFNVWLLKRPAPRDDDSLADDKVFLPPGEVVTCLFTNLYQRIK